MEGAIIDFHVDALHRIACYRASQHAFVDTLQNGGDEVARDRTTHGLVHEPFACLSFTAWIDAKIHFAKLSASAGLLLVAVVTFAHGGDGFAIGDFRCREFDVDVGL